MHPNICIEFELYLNVNFKIKQEPPPSIIINEEEI